MKFVQILTGGARGALILIVIALIVVTDILEDGERLLRNVVACAASTIARLESSHMDFSYIPYWDVSGTRKTRAGKPHDGDHPRLCAGLFDGCLKGRWAPCEKWPRSGKVYPDVYAQKFGAMWPQ